MQPSLASSPVRCRILGALLAGYALFDLRVFVADGLPLFFDAHSHLTRAAFAQRALEVGSFPTWSFDWYGGYRLFEFYAPGWYLLAGALGSATGDLAAATGWLLAAGQALSVLAVYALGIRLGVGAFPALFGALIHLHDAERWRVLAVIGNHPSVFVYALLPCVLLALTRSDGSPRRAPARVATCALLLSSMAFGHLTNTLAVMPALGAFALLWLWQETPPGGLPRAAAGVAACGIAVVLATLGLTLPMLRSLHLVALSLDVGALGFELEPVAIALGLRTDTMRRVFVTSPGAFWCALAFVAATLSLRRRYARFRPFALGLCASLLSLAVLGDRAAIGMIFFLAPLCAAALAFASGGVARRAGPRAALALELAAVAAVPLWHATRELAPLRLVDPAELSLYARIARPDSGGRSFDVTPVTDSLDGVYGQSSFSPVWTGRAIPFGGFPQGAPLATHLQVALVGRLVADLAAPQPLLSSESLDLLQLLGVEWLVDRGQPPTLGRVGVDPRDAERPEPGLLRLRHAAPALFAPAALPVPPDTGDGREGVAGLLERLEGRWDADPIDARGERSLDALARVGTRADWPLLLPLLQGMQIERGALRAGRFFVDPVLPPGPVPAPREARFAVLSHARDLRRVEIVADASAGGFVRLAYAHDPDLVVSLDGVATPFARDFLGGVVLPFPAGTHTVTLEPPPATLRLGLLGLSGSALFVLAMLCARSRIPGALHSTRAETS